MAGEKDEKFTIRMSKKEYEMLSYICDYNDRNRSDMLRDLIRREYDRRKAREKR